MTKRKRNVQRVTRKRNATYNATRRKRNERVRRDALRERMTRALIDAIVDTHTNHIIEHANDDIDAMSQRAYDERARVVDDVRRDATTIVRRAMTNDDDDDRTRDIIDHVVRHHVVAIVDDMRDDIAQSFDDIDDTHDYIDVTNDDDAMRVVTMCVRAIVRTIVRRNARTT